ncbi:MAG: hypothetical protein K2Q12_06690 [Rickettsiales bacterium]|nr:hypothetical protein [Rickettsiales bacterium]
MMEAYQVIEEARRWVGTRYQHQGRRRAQVPDRGGVDCLGLLIGVAAHLQLLDKQGHCLELSDELMYSRVPDGERLRQVLSHLLHEMPASSSPKPANVGLFAFDGQPQHLGLFGQTFTDEPSHLTLIHAYAPARRVVETQFDATWRARLVTHFALPDLMNEANI